MLFLHFLSLFGYFTHFRRPEERHYHYLHAPIIRYRKPMFGQKLLPVVLYILIHAFFMLNKI